MAIRQDPVDVVLVGMGWTASILALGLARAGLNVVALERGRYHDTVPDWQTAAMHDEIKYSIRHGMMQNTARETVTFRNRVDETALPMRQLGSFLPGTDVGGAGVHWNGQNWRFLPWDFEMRSQVTERYGADFTEPELTFQDWGVTYDELEPYFDQWEYLAGIGGIAGNLNGEIQEGGNPFEGPRARPFPNPPMITSHAGAIFQEGTGNLGYHPFPIPSANMTRHYVNTEGLAMMPCMYCGFCERYGCEHWAKASPQACILPVLFQEPGFSLRTHSHVTRVLHDGERATGVRYIDGQGREVEQPAEIVILCAYSFNNVRLLLNSGIGEPYDPVANTGVVGRNYCYQTMASVQAFFPDKRINPFMGAGALGMAIDEFNGDNFDHSELNFVGGGYIGALNSGGRPIEYHPVPDGTPRWGAEWKRAVAEHYNHAQALSIHGSSTAHRANYLSLDPTYRDAYGEPLLRMTFDFPDNDLRMSRYLVARAEEIAHAMGGTNISANHTSEHYSIVPYQTTHNTGGAIMGENPATSALNRYLQCWDMHNVFVMGASAYPQNAGYNPTGTVGALTYWALDAIINQYLPNPGPLVQT